MDRKIFLATLTLLAIMAAFYAVAYIKVMPIIDKANAIVDDVSNISNTLGITKPNKQ